MLVKQVCNARSENARLTGAGARKNEDAFFGGGNRLKLFGIEA